MRPEPRSMTLVDSMVLVIGVALAFYFVHFSAYALVFQVYPPAIATSIVADLFLTGSALAISMVCLVRQFRHRRMTRASEWLALLIAIDMFDSHFEFKRIQGFEWFARTAGLPAEFPGSVWVMVGLVVIAMLGEGLILVLLRRWIPPWLKTLALAWLALLARVGPFGLISSKGADLISPRGGFGPGLLAVLHHEVCDLLALIPTGLLYAVPAVAALMQFRSRRTWAWTEWAALGIASSLGFVCLVFWQGNFPVLSFAWLAERMLLMTWLFWLGLLGWSIVRLLDPAWRSWIEGTTDRNRSPASDPS